MLILLKFSGFDKEMTIPNKKKKERKGENEKRYHQIFIRKIDDINSKLEQFLLPVPKVSLIVQI